MSVKHQCFEIIPTDSPICFYFNVISLQYNFYGTQNTINVIRYCKKWQHKLYCIQNRILEKDLKVDNRKNIAQLDYLVETDNKIKGSSATNLANPEAGSWMLKSEIYE